MLSFRYLYYEIDRHITLETEKRDRFRRTTRIIRITVGFQERQVYFVYYVFRYWTCVRIYAKIGDWITLLHFYKYLYLRDKGQEMVSVPWYNLCLLVYYYLDSRSMLLSFENCANSSRDNLYFMQLASNCTLLVELSRIIHSHIFIRSPINWKDLKSIIFRNGIYWWNLVFPLNHEPDLFSRTLLS